jgi:hypothetical protein
MGWSSSKYSGFIHKPSFPLILISIISDSIQRIAMRDRILQWLKDRMALSCNGGRVGAYYAFCGCMFSL